ncbi:hypothetical protein QR680_016010 [Steinernema hermaphroditum]|uniref:Protein xylosyltransferase n=1 Tax=Steinernema hermaphroditum TaxID=289476 RepID=A0AA39HA02_9BILA|nr:hypothetical protein QR680_016010 [Steinernema hermaphroditum]
MNLLFHLRIVLAILSVAAVAIVLIHTNKQHRRNKKLRSMSTTTHMPITGQTLSLELMNLSSTRIAFDALMDNIPLYRNQVDFEAILQWNGERVKAAETWAFDVNMFSQRIEKYTDLCQAIKETFLFFDKPLSQEEYEFPLAYGMLVHDNFLQILFLLSSVYQPQNQFCIAVDGDASEDFQKQLYKVADCFPNIFVTITTKVRWCEFSVLRGVFECVRYLAKLEADWKYYQYLSGVDLPLKTNLEMVRIFKQLNGSFNAGIYDLEWYRQKHGVPPVPIWKSSLSSTFSRASAEFMITHPKVKEVLDYLADTICPDESFWASIAGNPREIPMPGGFDAALWKQKLTGQWRPKYVKHKNVTKHTEFGLFVPEKYYISRYQVWHVKSMWHLCHGQFVSGSCAFGVTDLPMLVRRPELVAHKLYFSVHPAAYFCLYETVRRRALKADGNFSVEAYGDLPGPQLMRGVPFELVSITAPNGYEYY